MTRRAAIAFWVALFLLFGQQGAVLHELAHAVDQIAPVKQLPAQSNCDLCLVMAPISGGAVGTTVPVIPAIAAEPPRAIIVAERFAPIAAPVYFLSQGPPNALHA